MKNKEPNEKRIKKEKLNFQDPFGLRDVILGGDIPSLESELRYIRMKSNHAKSETDSKKPNGKT